MLVNLITLAAFLAVAGVVYLLVTAVAQLQQDPVRDRLAAAAQGKAVARPARRGLVSPRSEGEAIGKKKGGWKVSPAFMESLAGQLPQVSANTGELERDLRRAGYYKPTARRDFLALRNGLMILVVIVSGIIAAMIGPEHPNLVLGTVAGGLVILALAWAVPRVYLAFKGHWRIQRIRATLPDALDMMTMCMTGGLPMQEALVHVSRELYFAHPELALEFLIVRQHADMSSLETAFARFADRVDGPEIVALASLITQNQRLGANVAAAIYDFSDSLRLQRRQSADELAGRASVKILLPIALCLLPSVLMVMWGPGVIELMQFFRSFDSPDSLNF